MRPRLIYYCHEPTGGLADYAHEQANAIVERGVEVSMVAPPGFSGFDKKASYSAVQILPNPPAKSASSSRIVRRIRSALWILKSINQLASFIRGEKIDRVLMGAYFEYLAPIWAHKLQRCAARGAVFGSVVHDPVREGAIGPLWWNQRSVASAYSFIREAFVHYPIELNTVRSAPGLRTTVIPHGPYRFAPATRERREVRQKLGVPGDRILMLAFGHIRDNKNLHLVLEAMVNRPEFYLLVAGLELGARQRPAADYKAMAARLGVADRCRWENRHIPEDEVGNFFQAADLVLLTYDSRFRSASGVLNAAVNFRRPCLASSGQSNLRAVVEKYRLGYWVEPDSVAEIEVGLRKFLREKSSPSWDEYEKENSWEENAGFVIERMFGLGVGAGGPTLNASGNAIEPKALLPQTQQASIGLPLEVLKTFLK